MELPEPYVTHLATSDDAVTIADLMTRYDADDGDVTTATQILAILDDERAVLHVIMDGEGLIVGSVEMTCNDEAPGEVSFNDYVERRLALELIPPVLAMIERLAGPDATLLRTWGHHRDEPRSTQLRDAGWHVVTTYHRMRLDLPESPPYPPHPGGVVLRNPTQADLPIVHRIVVDAFAEHQGPPSASDLATWLEDMVYDGRAHDLDLWWLALVDGEPVGALVGTTRDDGWVKKLAVLKSARGRGIGRLLLLTAIARFGERGAPSVGLGVDINNATGALALYESVGMRVEERFLAWEKRRS